MKAEIDAVFAMADLDALFEYAGDISRAPEARLFAAAKCKASFEIAVTERRRRPDVGLTDIQARVAGLASRKWQSPTHYGSLLDAPAGPGRPGPVPREKRLAE